MLAAAFAALTTPAYSSAYNTQSLMTYEIPDYQERQAYENIVDSWNLGDYEDFLDEYPHSAFSNEIKSRINEIKLWNNARGLNTMDSYQNYLKNSQYGRYNQQAIAALEDIQAQITENEWRTTCGVNTIGAYQSFISRFPNAPQVPQAEARIENLKTQEEWNRIKDSDDVVLLEEFVTNYPDFQNIEFAKSRLHALRMSDYFDMNDIELASIEFDYITDEEAVPPSASIAYGIVQEYNAFKKLSPRSTESELKAFLSKYNGSQYQADVKNYIALNKASRFTTSSTKEEYDDALSYATNQTTRNQVQQMIKNNDKNISYEKKLARSYRRSANGGWMGLTFEYGDLSWNGRTTNGLMRYNFGVKFRIGNYADRVQLSLGVKPGVGIWDFEGIYVDDGYGYDKGKSSAFFEMPAEAELKINLVKTGSETWFFLDGRYDYNVIRKKEVQRPMGFRAGIGWAGHSWDFIMYYGMELGDIDPEYSMLNGHYNPFMDKKTASFFGISLSATVKLF